MKNNSGLIQILLTLIVMLFIDSVVFAQIVTKTQSKIYRTSKKTRRVSKADLNYLNFVDKEIVNFVSTKFAQVKESDQLVLEQLNFADIAEKCVNIINKSHEILFENIKHKVPRTLAKVVCTYKGLSVLGGLAPEIKNYVKNNKMTLGVIIQTYALTEMSQNNNHLVIYLYNLLDDLVNEIKTDSLNYE